MHSPRLADAASAQRHVFLRDMVIAARVGVHAFEHDAPQRIRINVDLAVEEAEPGQATASAPPAVGPDQLSRVVDYESVARSVRAIVAAGHVRLIETLAERIAESCLADGRVRSAYIRIEKLDIFPDMASVGIEIERRRPPP